MTQDIGPEEEVTEEVEEPVEPEDSDEPADERETEDWRTAVRAVIVIVVVVLILLLCRCGSGGLGGSTDGRNSTSTQTPLAPITADENRVPNQPFEDGPFVPDVIGMTRSAAISATCTGRRIPTAPCSSSIRAVVLAWMRAGRSGCSCSFGGSAW
jgi:hypothetical protein